jgi:hypothetical protein
MQRAAAEVRREGVCPSGFCPSGFWARLGATFAAVAFVLGSGTATAQVRRVATVMEPSPERAALCAHGCRTRAQRRVAGARIRVIEARRSDVLADGSALLLVIEVGEASYTLPLAEGGAFCGGDGMSFTHVTLDGLSLVDFAGDATPEIVVDWRETSGGDGGSASSFRSVACSVAYGVPTCSDAGPAVTAELALRSFPGSGRVVYGAPETAIVIAFESTAL